MAEVELYDLNSDPYEEANVAGQPRWAAKELELQALLLQYQDCRGATCR